MKESKFLDIFKEKNGQFSSQRVMFVMGIVLIMVTWVFICFRSWSMLPFDETHLIALGIFITGKVTSKMTEK